MKNVDLKSLIKEALVRSKSSICSYFNLNDDQFGKLLNGFIIGRRFSGFNNQVCFINFYDSEYKSLYEICFKYSLQSNDVVVLNSEARILNLLQYNSVCCPKLISLGSAKNGAIPYLFIEKLNGQKLTKNISRKSLNGQDILQVIDSHELVLLKNKNSITSIIAKNLHRKIDFKKKIEFLLLGLVPDIVINEQLGFLNYYLNHKKIINSRRIVTDRSPENMIIKDSNIAMIDFSTIRIGTKFDNWIQFIDYPELSGKIDKVGLQQLFFKKVKLAKKDYKFYYAASIYTNLLQGIFTYKKCPELAKGYFKNVNESFVLLKNNKSVLVDIRH